MTTIQHKQTVKKCYYMLERAPSHCGKTSLVCPIGFQRLGPLVKLFKNILTVRKKHRRH